MSDQMVTLAEKEEQERKNRLTQKRRAKEEWNQKYIPLSAIIVANVIFFSLDIRAFQAIYLITASYMLATLTVLISGGLAMYWFDVLYPHSRRHDNEVQTNLSMISTVLAILLSGVLAFADYVVGTGTTFSKGWSITLWAAVIILTIYQGVAIAWWWSIDNHIAAEARIQKMHAEETDKQDNIDSMRAKLKGLRGFLDELNKLNSDYSPESVKAVATILGISLPDDKTGSQRQNFTPQNQQRSFAADTSRVKEERPNSHGAEE